MLNAGKTELQVLHYILYQHSVKHHGALSHICVIVSFTSLNETENKLYNN